MINYENSVLQIIMEIYYTLQQQQIICTIFNRDKIQNKRKCYIGNQIYIQCQNRNVYYEGQERN